MKSGSSVIDGIKIKLFLLETSRWVASQSLHFFSHNFHFDWNWIYSFTLKSNWIELKQCKSTASLIVLIDVNEKQKITATIILWLRFFYRFVNADRKCLFLQLMIFNGKNKKRRIAMCEAHTSQQSTESECIEWKNQIAQWHTRSSHRRNCIRRWRCCWRRRCLRRQRQR